MNNLNNNSKSNQNYEGKKNPSFNNDNKHSKGNYNTEINNRRFEIDPLEDKRNILTTVNRNTPKNYNKAVKRDSSKQYKSKSK